LVHDERCAIAEFTGWIQEGVCVEEQVGMLVVNLRNADSVDEIKAYLLEFGSDNA
jgi:hypothetical protein